MKKECVVSPEQLRRTWASGGLGFTTTQELPELHGLVGQEQAVDSLNFGLTMRSPGYNIYVAGAAGTGKTTYTCSLVRAHAKTEPTAQDWVYVHNFDSPDEPLALALPTGGAPTFASDVDELVGDARRAAVRAMTAKEHQARKEMLVRQTRLQISQVMAEVESVAGKVGFTLAQTPQGLMPIPTSEGQPLTEQQFSQLPKESREQLSDKGQEMRKLIVEAAQQTWELEKGLQQQLRELDSEAVGQVVTPMVTALNERYKHLTEVSAWLQRMEGELVGQSLPSPVAQSAMASPAMEEAAAALEIPTDRRTRVDPFSRFKVNVFVHQLKAQGAPVVMESNPTYFNLFGRAELTPTPSGGVTSGVMQIRSGALHRANGGYLILQMNDLMRSVPVWEALKRALSTREARIEAPDQENRLLPVYPMRPQEIPLAVKVLLIGRSQIYRFLYQQDEGFRKLFKVKAEFDTIMDATQENVSGYASFVARLCRREGLKHLTAGAVSQVIEQSHRMASDQDKLSACFNDVVELIYEANAWSAAEKSDLVEARHVDRAIAQKSARSALPELRLQEMIKRGTLMVDVDGAVVGQVNGLTVMSVGDHAFGSPSRITARVYTGNSGVLHIEREIAMSGQMHDKGLLTLVGFLGDRFAQDRPLNFSASIAFEQTYVPVDGDSASSTELYALLSALAEVPIDQGIAVTGSVNQRGEVQPIGGVNEKVEGFYQVCKARGLTGRQGVMIPRQNLKNLMLSEELIEEVQAGRFWVWAVARIEEGIEVLTGLTAGNRGEDGTYPTGSLFDKVDRRIERLVLSRNRWSAGGLDH